MVHDAREPDSPKLSHLCSGELSWGVNARATQAARVLWLGDDRTPPESLLSATRERGLEPVVVRSSPALVVELVRRRVEDVVCVGQVPADRQAELHRVLQVYYPSIRLHHWSEPDPATGESADASSRPGHVPPSATAAPQVPDAASSTTPSVTAEELEMLFGSASEGLEGHNGHHGHRGASVPASPRMGGWRVTSDRAEPSGPGLGSPA